MNPFPNFVCHIGCGVFTSPSIFTSWTRQGPFSIEDAEVNGSSSIVWLYVVLGEIGAGAGLLVGGFLQLSKVSGKN